MLQVWLVQLVGLLQLQALELGLQQDFGVHRGQEHGHDFSLDDRKTASEHVLELLFLWWTHDCKLAMACFALRWISTFALAGFTRSERSQVFPWASAACRAMDGSQQIRPDVVISDHVCRRWNNKATNSVNLWRVESKKTCFPNLSNTPRNPQNLALEIWCPCRRDAKAWEKTGWGWIRGTRAKGKECKFYHDPKAAPKKKPSAAAGENENKPKPKPGPKPKGKAGAPAIGQYETVEESHNEGIAATWDIGHVCAEEGQATTSIRREDEEDCKEPRSKHLQKVGEYFDFENAYEAIATYGHGTYAPGISERRQAATSSTEDMPRAKPSEALGLSRQTFVSHPTSTSAQWQPQLNPKGKGKQGSHPRGQDEGDHYQWRGKGINGMSHERKW